MKKILVLAQLVVSILMFSSCVEGEDSEHCMISTKGHYLDADLSLSFDAAGQMIDIYIYANSETSWTITGAPSWLKISPSSGTGPKNVKITATPNIGFSDRKATLTLKSAHKDYPFSEKSEITQKSTNAGQISEGIFSVNGVTFNMVKVEGGTFVMGATSEQSTDAYKNEEPTHKVTLSSYYIGETEVTYALWYVVMNSGYLIYDEPTRNVDWYDCRNFIRKLNTLTGKNFRLPTEAEWEYAARGGQKSKGYKYSGSNSIDDVAWYDGNAGAFAEEVKTKLPNELGIYDMSGNVLEWCLDWYGDYSASAQTNPTGPTTGSDRVFRGGSWFASARGCRVSFRGSGSPSDRGLNLGLRLVLSE